VPRADLVLFVTSADRPLSESERVFLETIRQWGKKVAMVVNKIDILRSEDEVAEVVDYVSSNASRLLGADPEVFPVSALRAAEAKDAEARAASGLPVVEAFLHDTLDSGELLRLKLGNPLGVAAHLLSGALETVAGRLELLGDDLRTIDDIERQTETWTSDVRREFDLRLSDIDNVLHGMERRGVDFFDDTVRLTQLPKLFDKSELTKRFEAEVVADAPEAVEAKVDSLIDWLVDSELGHWQNVVNHVNRRVGKHADRMVGEVGGRFETDRTRLLETVGRAARDGLASYDRAAEASRMAEDLHQAVTSTAVLEVGAVGLGAAVALAASSTAADITGLTAAGLMAALGLFVLPHRRRRAKSELKQKIAALRSNLMAALSPQRPLRGRVGARPPPPRRHYRAVHEVRAVGVGAPRRRTRCAGGPLRARRRNDGASQRLTFKRFNVSRPAHSRGKLSAHLRQRPAGCPRHPGGLHLCLERRQIDVDQSPQLSVDLEELLGGDLEGAAVSRGWAVVGLPIGK